MGSWAGSCAISNLHIKDQDDVVVFALLKNKDELNNFIYNNSLYSVCPLPFYATYNDYGACINEHGAGFDPFMKLLTQRMVEFEIGDNKYHDIEVKKEGFNAEKMWDANHEERLYFKPYGKDQLKVELIMVHRAVFDAIIAERHQYMAKNQDGEYVYFYYTFQDVADLVPAFVDTLYDAISEISALSDTITKCDAISTQQLMMKKYMLPVTVFNYDENNKLSRYLSNDSYKWAIVDRLKDYIIQYAEKYSKEETIALIVELLKGIFVDDFVTDTRKLWVPPSGRGSQSQAHSPYRTLIKAMSEILDKEKEEWDSDDDD
jgi:hypothetical protein